MLYVIPSHQSRHRNRLLSVSLYCDSFISLFTIYWSPQVVDVWVILPSTEIRSDISEYRLYARDTIDNQTCYDV